MEAPLFFGRSTEWLPSHARDAGGIWVRRDKRRVMSHADPVQSDIPSKAKVWLTSPALILYEALRTPACLIGHQPLGCDTVPLAKVKSYRPTVFTVSLSGAKIAVHRLREVGTEKGALLSDGTQLPADCIIAATGARASCRLALSGLISGENGYIAVDGHYRSISYPDVFAAGDICTRQDMVVARSGVHAVHAGPVLAANLLVALHGGTMRLYRPRCRS